MRSLLFAVALLVATGAAATARAERPGPGCAYGVIETTNGGALGANLDTNGYTIVDGPGDVTVNDQLGVATSVTSPFYQGTTANQAASGIYRTANADPGLCARNATNTGDSCVTYAAGNFWSIGSTVSVGGSILAAATSPIAFSGITSLYAPGASKLKFGATAGTISTLGVVLDASTDGTLKLRNAADNADGALTFGAGTASTSVTSPYFSTNAANAAASGLLRTANNENVYCSRNAANTADACFSLNTSNNWVVGSNANGLSLIDSRWLYLGTSADAYLGYSATQTPDAAFFGVGADSRGFVIAEAADSGYDFAHALQANPTMFIQSANQSAAEWISFAHNQTTGVIDTGTNVPVSIPDGVSTASFTNTGPMANTPTAVTIADSGGAGAATSTLTTPASTNYRYTCSDADGCTLTLGETSVADGQRLEISNVGTNKLSIADSSGVQELRMDRTARLSQYDSIRFIYHSDRWQEAGAVESDEFYGEIAATPPAALTVVIAATDTFVEVAPTTALNADSGNCFSQSANGRLRYDCANTRKFHCASTVSYKANAGTNQVLRFRFTDNGSEVATSEAKDTAGNTTDWESTALHAMVTLASGQYVSVVAANATSTNDIDVDTLNIFCMGAM